MKTLSIAVATALLVAVSAARMLAADPADPGVTLIGVGSVSGSATDLSGLKGSSICAIDIDKLVTGNCIDAATLGGFGSGFTYTGHDNVFLGVPDRGPFDGRTDVPYPTRFHLFHITVNPSAPFPNITTVLLDTRFLTATGNTSLPGDAYEFETRFDPEGARVDAEGNFYVSDEYGPYILKFNRQGHLQARIEVPARFLLDAVTGHTSGDINNLSRNGLADVTDVSNVPALPEKGTDLAAMGITPVKKTLFLDLLKDVYKVNATQTIKDVVAEKLEALARGRRTCPSRCSRPDR